MSNSHTPLIAHTADDMRIKGELEAAAFGNVPIRGVLPQIAACRATIAGVHALSSGS